jgi:exopolysaccharide biosynthesis polyprenyl glycosylphosphotransferase
MHAHLSPGTAAAPPVSVPAALGLPETDSRQWLNDRALRGWTESSRRFLRNTTLFVSDAVAGVLAIATVVQAWDVVSDGGARLQPDPIPLLAMVVCLLPLALRASGAYGGGRARTDLLTITGGVVIATVVGWAQARLFGNALPTLPNKTAYLFAAAVMVPYLWTFRLVIDYLVVIAYRSRQLQRRVLIVGSEREADELNRRCREIDGCEIDLVGRLAPYGPESEVESVRPFGASGIPFRGDVRRLEEALTATGARGIIVVGNMSFSRLEAVVGDCFRLGASVSIVPTVLKQLSGTRLEVRHSPIGSLLQLRPVRLDVPHLAVKRTIDIALTVVGLAITWPLFVLIAVAIKLDSPGPVFFTQVRAGVGCKPFRMFKFRTMRDGTDQQKQDLAHLNESGDPRLFKIRHDPRVTRVGRLLRRTSLDELPQVLNVLRGEMSLVGPRPFFPQDVAEYDQHHFERLHVLPGITGLWQVSGRSDVVDFEEVIRLDREYIENWSVLTDVWILLRTLPAAFGRGAY